MSSICTWKLADIHGPDITWEVTLQEWSIITKALAKVADFSTEDMNCGTFK